MSRFGSVVRAAVALVVIAGLAAVASLAFRVLLGGAGVPPDQAGPVGVVTAVAVALAVADVYTPIGRGPRYGDIGEQGASAIAADLLLTAVLSLAVSTALVLLGETVWAPLGNLVVVFVLGVGVGYGAFMLRNREYYLGSRGADAAGE